MTLGLVLLIDGDDVTTRPLAAALQERGYGVEICKEAVPGFRKACAMLPDCIVLNPDLSDIDGAWVARKVRTEPGPIARVPLLFVGELWDNTLRTRTLNVGADVFLERPAPTEDIVAQVVALIAMARRLDVRPESGPMSMSVGAAIKGDLASFPIASLLMMFEMERRSGLVEVVSESGKRATLTITSGLFASTEIAGAQRPALEVLREVLSWRAGRFSFHARESEALPAPRASVAALVLEAVRLEDEEKSPLPELDSDDLVEADSERGGDVNDTERPPAGAEPTFGHSAPPPGTNDVF